MVDWNFADEIRAHSHLFTRKSKEFWTFFWLSFLENAETVLNIKGSHASIWGERRLWPFVGLCMY